MTFEYILIAGVNDTDEQARELSKIARRLSAKINLIPYNTVEGLDWSRPSRERQEKFQSILRNHGVTATLRREKGHDIAAACGQLRLQTKRAGRGSSVIDPDTAAKTAKGLIKNNAALFKRLS
jgi:23S rRNA (adenine2503-C2)-methyltransferase